MTEPTPPAVPEPTPAAATPAPAAATPAAAPYTAPAAPTGAGRPTNVLAIIALIAAFVFPLAGIIVGHIALSQIKKTGEQGKVFAIIGLVLGYLGILAAIIFLVIFLPLIFLAASNGSVSGY